MGKIYGFGIVGAGMVAGIHAMAIQEIQRARVVAVMAPHIEHARSLAKKYSADACDTLEELVSRDDVDVVDVCSPSGVHMEAAVKGAEAGKHVLVEKPLDVTLERCDRIIEACESGKVKLGGIFQNRFEDNTLLIKGKIERGRFGRLILCDAYVKWYRDEQYYESSSWKGTWEFDGGGALMNQSIHAVDLLQWFAGDVASVRAFSETLLHRIEVEDTAVAILRFRNGALGVIEGTTACYPGFAKRIEIHGEKGTAILEDENIVRWDFVDEGAEDREIKGRCAERKVVGAGASDAAAIKHINHKRQVENFLDGIEGKDEILVDGYEARKAAEIVLAIYRASRENKEIKLPL